MNIARNIEAILFFKGESITIKKLASILNISQEEVTAGIETLKKDLEGRALTIITKDDEVLLATAPEVSELIENLVKDELSRDLGKAGLETLSIILYKGPIARRDVDYIRGVNSQFIIRNLLVRGLIEKISSETDQRSFLYKPSFELYSYLGITDKSQLPEYAKVQEELVAFMKKEEEQENKPAESNV
jgi:segregation and condensation protein B